MILRLVATLALTITFLAYPGQEQKALVSATTAFDVSANVELPELRVPIAPASTAAAPIVSSAPSQVSKGVRQTIINIDYVSQLSEPSPKGWTAWYTPYCAAASSVMVMRSFGVTLPSSPLATTFALGRAGNTTWDPGLDPDGLSFLFRQYGGSGTIHAYRDSDEALTELVGRINWGSPVVVFAQAGNHAIVAYGYEVDEGGTVTAIYAADPLSGFNGRVSINAWSNWYDWFGARFSAPGLQWQGTYVFVSYRDFR